MTPRLTRLIWILVAVSVAAAAVIAFAVSGGGGGGNNATKPAHAVEQAPVKVVGTALPELPAYGNDPAVEMTMPTLTGRSVMTGKPLEIAVGAKPQVLAFVAHWCPHCQAEVPRIVTLAGAGTFDGVQVTAIATGTNSGYPNYPPSAWLRRVHWPYPVLADSTKYTAARAYGLTAYPFLVFVDAQGKVVGRTTGEIEPDVLTTYIDALKAGKPIPIQRPGASSSAK